MPSAIGRLSSADYRANRDPALEAILSVPPGTFSVAPYPDRVADALRAYGGL